MKQFKTLAKVGLGLALSLASTYTVVAAQCGGWLPEFLQGFVCEDPVNNLTNRVKVFFVLAFGAVILMGVVYTISAALKFMRSKGESGEIENSQKAVTAIFYGVASLFVGVIGMVVVTLFFSPTVIFPQQICIQAPDSYGCFACRNPKKGSNVSFVDICNACNDVSEAPLSDISGNVTCADDVPANISDDDIVLKLDEVKTVGTKKVGV